MDKGDAQCMETEAMVRHASVQEVSGNGPCETQGMRGVHSQLVGSASGRTEEYFYSTVIIS